MSAKRLTAAERKALKLVTNAGIAVRKAVFEPYRKPWFDGYTSALRGMAETLPWVRRLERQGQVVRRVLAAVAKARATRSKRIFDGKPTTQKGS